VPARKLPAATAPSTAPDSSDTRLASPLELPRRPRSLRLAASVESQSASDVDGCVLGLDGDTVLGGRWDMSI